MGDKRQKQIWQWDGPAREILHAGRMFYERRAVRQADEGYVPPAEPPGKLVQDYWDFRILASKGVESAEKSFTRGLAKLCKGPRVS